MKFITCIYFVLTLCFFSHTEAKPREEAQDFILSTHKIDLKKYPHAFNPSIVKSKQGFLLTFRHCLAPEEPEVSYIGIIALDENLQPISRPQLLRTRSSRSKIPSRSEDARIFSFKDEIYVVFNDSISSEDRRDMFIARIGYNEANGQFSISKPRKLCYLEKYETRKIQKNWTPFEWQKTLLFIYTGNPHEIIYPDLHSGVCKQLYSTSFMANWTWGEIRGGTPALLVDGEYLTFFHSMKHTASAASNGIPMYHYYMGAYTFSSEPPFEVQKLSPMPIIGKDFYTRSRLDKKVIFPGGFAVSESYIYIAYGKDDRAIYIATIDKKKLKASLMPCRGL